MVAIPLRGKHGAGRVALVSDRDARLASHRWFFNPTTGYVTRNTPRSAGPRTTVALHREVMGLRRGDGLDVDHRNGDKLDCRRSNLRVCTRSENIKACWDRLGAAHGRRALELPATSLTVSRDSSRDVGSAR